MLDLDNTHRFENWKKHRLGYLLIMPTVTILLVFLIFPVISGILMSFRETSLQGVTHFVGFKNYLLLLRESRFLNNLLLSCIYVLGNLGLSVPLSYMVAILITRKLRGTQFFQSIFLLPWIIAPVVSALLFRSMVDPVIGPLAALVELITSENVIILADPKWAMATVILHSVWRSFPFMMLFLAAGIFAIPTEIYEAAKVDGASPWNRFWLITFPLTKLHLSIVLVIITMWTLQDAETVWAMTQGGPGYGTEVTAVRLLKEAFVNLHLNIGATIGFVLLSVGIVYMMIYMRLSGYLGRKGEAA